VPMPARFSVAPLHAAAANHETANPTHSKRIARPGGIGAAFPVLARLFGEGSRPISTTR
jgi:hypothetical protein